MNKNEKEKKRRKMIPPKTSFVQEIVRENLMKNEKINGSKSVEKMKE
jgi:hypothetical protein